MRFCLVIALLLALSLPSIVSAEQQFGAVVRIHFDESPFPDLSVIRDTYRGSGPTICAHIVIDSLPQGVSGYHLAYEIVSEDSSVVVLSGFHLSPGWTVLDPSRDFASAGGGRIASTPVSVGYWRLWLKGGRESSAYVRVIPVRVTSGYEVSLRGDSTAAMVAATLHQGGVNMRPPLPTLLQNPPILQPSRWEGLSTLHPVWELEIDGDSCRLVDGYYGKAAHVFGHRGFPVDFIQVGKRYEATHPRLGAVSAFATAYIRVQEDGAPLSGTIAWLSPRQPQGAGECVGASQAGTVCVVTRDGTTDLLDAQGRTTAMLPAAVEWALCFDIPKRVAAVATQTLPAGGAASQLSRLLVLDYQGHTLYEGAWSECKIANVGMGQDPDVVKCTLAGCGAEGDYLIRISQDRVYSLRGLPRTGRCFSPDSRAILVNDAGTLSYFNAEDPESPRLLWRRRIEGTVSDVAISDGMRFAAYKIAAGASESPCIYVLSGTDGSPVCRLSEGARGPVPGPMGFTGDYLFVGMDFSLGGTPWQTTAVYVFDLALTDHR